MDLLTYCSSSSAKIDDCRVLNAADIPHPNQLESVVRMRRTEPVYAWTAEQGDVITLNPNTLNQRTVMAEGGETVFIKRLGTTEDAPLKVYIPKDSAGKMAPHILDDKYVPGVPCHLRDNDPVLTQVPEGRALFVRHPHKDLLVPMLVEAVSEPTIILNARGKGENQRLMPGDSLKYEENQWLGVPKAEMAQAWEIVTSPSAKSRLER